MSPTAEACARSAEVRADRARYRLAVSNGEMTLRELACDGDIPPSVASIRAFEFVTWPYAWSVASTRRSPLRFWLQRLNFAAIHSGVNVFEEVGRMNARQRGWLVGYVEANPASRRRRAA